MQDTATSYQQSSVETAEREETLLGQLDDIETIDDATDYKAINIHKQTKKICSIQSALDVIVLKWLPFDND